MKRYFLLLGAAFSFAFATQAQLFIELHGDYLMPIGGYGMASSTDTKVSSELVNFGKGAGGGFVIGGTLSNALGLEARITFVSGTEQSFNNTSTGVYSNSAGTDTYKTNYIRFEPAVRLSVGEGALKGYVAVGPSLAFTPKLSYSSTYTYTYMDPYSYHAHSYEDTDDYKGGIGWGGFGALGLTWSSGGAFGLFAEVQAVAQNWAPKESRNTSEETQLDGSGAVEYDSDSNTIHYDDSYNVDEENKSVKLHLPMSTWGLRAGVRFTFGGS